MRIICARSVELPGYPPPLDSGRLRLMRAWAFVFLAALTAFGADDPWSKVKDLKSGTEVRIYKKGSTVPVLAKSSDVTDDKMIVVLKNAETAISKSDIDRIDARPSTKRVVTKSTTTKTNEVTMQPRSANDQIPVPSPSSSSSSNVSFGSKPDFVTVYRRAAPAH